MVALLLVLALHAAPASPTVTLEHAPAGVCTVGQPFQIAARIKAVAGRRVFEPAVFVRPAGAKSFQRLGMLPGGAVDTFVTRLGPELTTKDLEYFLEAFDEVGHGPFRLGSPEAPFKLAVLVAPPPAPVSLPLPPPAATTTTAATTAPAPGKPVPGEGSAPAPVAGPVAASTPPAAGAPASPGPAATEFTPITIEKPVPAAASARPPFWRPTTVAGVATLGGGAALLIAGGVVGVLATKDYDDQKTAVANNDLPAWERAKEATRTKSIAANVLLGVGGAAALAGAGLTLYGVLTRGSAPEPAVAVGFAAGPGVVGATVTGRF